MFESCSDMFAAMDKAAAQVDREQKMFREKYPEGVSVEFADGTCGHISPIPESSPTLSELLREAGINAEDGT